MATVSKNLWGEKPYISQVEPPHSQIPFGDGTIKDYGCGACSTANVVLHMGGDSIPFSEVVSYYSRQGQPTRAFGRTFGIMPWKICGFFQPGGPLQSVHTAASLEWGAGGLRHQLQSSRYVIAAVLWRGGGAHYIACMQSAGGGLSIVDPGQRYGQMQMDLQDIDAYLARYGGGSVIGAIGINVV